MTVTLTPEAEAAVREKIESGRYQTADDVIHEALRALDEREGLEQLRAKLQTGREQLSLGLGIPFTPEWRAERWQVALRRAAAGESPNPDVCP
jgi:antitoxin ParD1/3/4